MLAESVELQGIDGLSASLFRILDIIDSGVDKPAEIARALDISPPAITWGLENLERMGLLERTPDRSDRRRVVPTLTGKGKKVVREVNSRRGRRLKKVLDNIDEKALRSLDISLAALNNSYFQLKGQRS